MSLNQYVYTEEKPEQLPIQAFVYGDVAPQQPQAPPQPVQPIQPVPMEPEPVQAQVQSSGYQVGSTVEIDGDQAVLTEVECDGEGMVVRVVLNYHDGCTSHEEWGCNTDEFKRMGLVPQHASKYQVGCKVLLDGDEAVITGVEYGAQNNMTKVVVDYQDGCTSHEEICIGNDDFNRMKLM